MQGLECAIITCLWVGRQSEISQTDSLCAWEFAPGILCSRWYAIENVCEVCFSASEGTVLLPVYCISLDAQQCAKIHVHVRTLVFELS